MTVFGTPEKEDETEFIFTFLVGEGSFGGAKVEGLVARLRFFVRFVILVRISSPR